MFFRFAVLVTAALALAVLGEWVSAAPLQAGVVAPDFTAQGSDGKDFKLSDPKGDISKLYGAYRRLFAHRMTFIVGLDGKIAYANGDVTPEGHGRELAKVLTGLAAVSPWQKEGKGPGEAAAVKAVPGGVLPRKAAPASAGGF